MNIEPEYLARCGVCDYIDTETVVKEHVWLVHKENDVLVVENSFNENLDVENDAAGNTESQANLSTGHHWTDEEVKLLLSLYEQHKQDFEGRKLTNRSIWLKISRTMNEMGYEFTWEQCDNKFKNLKKTYKKIIDNNEKTGRGRINFKYFDILDNLFRRHPEIHPLSECSSIISNPTSPDNSHGNTSTHNSRESTPTRLVVTNKSTKSKKCDEEPLSFKKFREDTERRHQERLSVTTKMIDVLNKLANCSEEK